MELNERQWRTLKNVLVYSLLALVGFVIADLVSLNMKDDLLPRAAPPPKRVHIAAPAPKTMGDYAMILDRNIFNADGLIPDAIGGNAEADFERLATESKLPITLVATIVHGNPKLSVAAVRIQGVDGPRVFHDGEAIENLAVLRKIARGKIYFQNKSNNRIEFIEWKEGQPLMVTEFNARGGDDNIVRQGGNQFTVKREEIQKQTANLPSLLQQARAIPNLGPNGKVDGFRVVSLQPGSVFEKLGLQQQDVIKTVNGQPVDSPAKAIELFNMLRDAQNISLGIERNGRVENFSYSMN